VFFTYSSFSWSGLEELVLFNSRVILKPDASNPDVTFLQHIDEDVMSRWHHYALRWQAENGNIRIWVDGNSWVETVLKKTVDQPVPATGTLILGQLQKNLGGPFEAQHGFVGFMDEVRLWSKALAIGTIRAQMDTSLDPLQGKPEDLVFAWTFNTESAVTPLNSVFDSFGSFNGVRGTTDQLGALAVVPSGATVVAPGVAAIVEMTYDAIKNFSLPWSGTPLGPTKFRIPTLPAVATVIFQNGAQPEKGSSKSQITLFAVPILWNTPGSLPDTFLYEVTDLISNTTSPVVLRQAKLPQALDISMVTYSQIEFIAQFQCIASHPFSVTILNISTSCQLEQISKGGNGTRRIGPHIWPGDSVVHSSHIISGTCDETSTTTMTYVCEDEHGTSLQASMIVLVEPGTKVVQAGPSTCALDLNGIDEYITIVDVLGLTFQQSIQTIELNLLPTLSSTSAFLCFGCPNPLQVSLNSSHIVLSTTTEDFVASHNADLSQWVHVAIQFGDGTIVVYVDKFKSLSTNYTLCTLSNILVGTDCSLSSFFEMQLDEIKLWNRVVSNFSPKQRSDCVPDASLVGYFPFDECSGNVASDVQKNFQIIFPWSRPGWVASSLVLQAQADQEQPACLYATQTAGYFVIAGLPQYGSIFPGPLTEDQTIQPMQIFDIDAGLNSNFISRQWVQSVASFSSQLVVAYSASEVVYNASNIIGPISSGICWSPLASCQNNNVEWIEFEYASAVYPLSFNLYHGTTDDPSTVTLQVSALDTVSSGWFTIFSSSVLPLNPNSAILKIPFCNGTFPAKRFRISLFGCLPASITRIFSIELVGSAVLRSGIVASPTVYFFPNFSIIDSNAGRDSFSYARYDCDSGVMSPSSLLTIGLSKTSSRPIAIPMEINATEGEFTQIQLNATHDPKITSASLAFLIETVPGIGFLYPNTSESPIEPTTTPPARVLTSSVVYFFPPKGTCANAAEFTFSVSDRLLKSDDATVTLTVFCTPGTNIHPTSIVVLISILVCLSLVCCLVLIAWIIWRKKRFRGEIEVVLLLFILSGYFISFIFICFWFIPMSKSLCILQLWVGVCGIAILATTLFTRSYVRWKESIHVVTARRTSFGKEAFLWVLASWIAPVAGTLVLLILYTSINPPAPLYIPDPYYPLLTHVWCTHTQGWIIPIVVIQGTCLVLYVFLSWSQAYLTKVYREFIAAITLLGLAGLSIATLLTADRLQPYAIWVITFSEFLNLIVPFCLFFFPQVYTITTTVASDFDLNLPSFPNQDTTAQNKGPQEHISPQEPEVLLDTHSEHLEAKVAASFKAPKETPPVSKNKGEETSKTTEFQDLLKKKDQEIWILERKVLKRENQIQDLQNQLFHLNPENSSDL